ncbi:ABC transporter permease, partial [Anaerosporobacter sp.]|uniref:ABC transporter permease n=1 Tax=Anaerosporobacter sp. TaxID=1872529 RepID=UPI00286F0C8A
MNKRKKLFILTIIMVLILISTYIVGYCIPEDATAVDFANAKLKPSWQHLFGTDWLGRDLFARTMKGLRTSITVGLVASAISAVIALLIGIASAVGSKTLDAFINWVIDLVMSVPHLILIMLISFACGRGLKGLLIGIAVTHWTSLARLIRAEVLQLRTEHY